MTKHDFPLMTLNTDTADIALYLDGSIAIGGERFDLAVIQQLVAFLNMPGIQQYLATVALKRSCNEYLILDVPTTRADHSPPQGYGVFPKRDRFHAQCFSLDGEAKPLWNEKEAENRVTFLSLRVRRSCWYAGAANNIHTRITLNTIISGTDTYRQIRTHRKIIKMRAI